MPRWWEMLASSALRLLGDLADVFGAASQGLHDSQPLLVGQRLEQLGTLL